MKPRTPLTRFRRFRRFRRCRRFRVIWHVASSRLWGWLGPSAHEATRVAGPQKGKCPRDVPFGSRQLWRCRWWRRRAWPCASKGKPATTGAIRPVLIVPRFVLGAGFSKRLTQLGGACSISSVSTSTVQVPPVSERRLSITWRWRGARMDLFPGDPWSLVTLGERPGCILQVLSELP